ncbi:MAG: hypothetical protein IPL53_07090 [Ignavibacteria bacterium]|nr:hypothetical protein [Ignavibacteria bacterium]
MSENNINSDSKEPLRNEIPLNPGNEETNKQVSKDEKSQDKPDIPEKTGSDTGVDDLDKDEKELSEKANIDEEKKVLNTGDDDEKITGEVKPRIPDPPVKSKPKESNYQISLIDENLLKVVVTTKKGVKIFSSVKENRTLSETQNSEICFNPVFDYSLQEIEVLISIEEEIPSNETDNIVLSSADEGIADIGTDKEKSNYQINLINENLLKIKNINE